MEFSANTTEEAISEGLKTLKLKEEDAEIAVLQEPEKGLFGLVKKKAVVSVTRKRSGKLADLAAEKPAEKHAEKHAEKAEEKPAVKPAKEQKEKKPAVKPQEEKKNKPAKEKEQKRNVSVDEKQAENAVEFLKGLFEKLEITASATYKIEDGQIIIDVESGDSAPVIGYRGEVLDALQTLAGAMANVGKKDYVRTVVNCEGYREKREDTLVSLAHKLEDKATRLGANVELEPMNPYERRVIHAALADSKTVTTTSEGKEPKRYVVIVPNEKIEGAKPVRQENRQGGRHGRGGRGGRGERRPRQEGEKRQKPTTFGTFLGNFKDGE